MPRSQVIEPELDIRVFDLQAAAFSTNSMCDMRTAVQGQWQPCLIWIFLFSSMPQKTSWFVERVVSFLAYKSLSWCFLFLCFVLKAQTSKHGQQMLAGPHFLYGSPAPRRFESQINVSVRRLSSQLRKLVTDVIAFALCPGGKHACGWGLDVSEWKTLLLTLGNSREAQNKLPQRQDTVLPDVQDCC